MRRARDLIENPYRGAYKQTMRPLLLASLFVMVGCGGVSNHCTDGILDGNESDLDCGGSCAGCGTGEQCFGGADCAGGLCTSGICGSSNQCADFTRDGDETDIDCGGSVCGACGDGRACAVAADCASQTCSASGHCQEAAFTVPTDIYAIQGGAAALVAPGTQAGFAITSANGGSSFRLVWTGDGNVSGQYHEFYGSVYTAGTFSTVTQGCSGQCSVNPGDFISDPYPVTGGERVDFDSANAADLDGFDFVVAGANGGEPAYFDLFIDGAYVPMAVLFTDATTGQSAFPSSIPFGLTTQ